MNYVDKWNKKRFSVYANEEKTVLRIIAELSDTVGDIVDLLATNGLIPKEPTEPTGVFYSDKINLVSYAKENEIATDNDWSDALIQAIQYCIQFKRALFIPNGEYKINREIVIESNDEIGLVIEGESKSHTMLRFLGDAFDFKNIENTLNYEKRIRFINFKNITIRKQEYSKTDKGVRFKNFGYILMENVRIRDFATGLSLYNGSEFDMYNSELIGNALGLYVENPIGKETAYDMANINIYSTRIHNNDKTCLMENCREINFVGCALMNYVDGFTLNGITNIINFVSCDFENQATSSDLMINSRGIINITDCSMNNPHPNKIILNSNATLNLKGTLIQGNVLKTIVIKDNVYPTINQDKLYLGYYYERTTDFDNYSKPQQINIQNGNFEKGSCMPFSFSTPFTPSASTPTYGYSIYVDRLQTTDIAFHLNLQNFEEKVEPKYVEIIAKGLPTNNPLMVQFADGTYNYNFMVGGGDAVIGKITKNGEVWTKFGFLLPNNPPSNRITLLTLLIPKSTTSSLVYIDSIKVFGNGQFTRLYGDSMPLKGVWEPYDIVYAKDKTNVASQSISTPTIGWICSAAASSLTTNATFRRLTMTSST